MKNSRYSDSQIIRILKQAEVGTPIAELCREHGMSDPVSGTVRSVLEVGQAD